MSEEPVEVPMNVSMQISAEVEVGVFADFASVWHTPNTFVLDFLSIRRPPELPTLEGGEPKAGELLATVGARVRIPPEQIFPIIQALQNQGRQWLAETGRSEPPSSWLPGTTDQNQS